MASVFLELRRGVAMKFAGLAAKAAFILVFSHALNPGEFSKYFLGFSTAVIVSRILGMGADDELAYRVSGRASSASRYMGISVILALIGSVLVLASLVASDWAFYILCAGVAFMLAGNSFSTGALRSLDNFYQEMRANLPWVLVCLFVWILPFRTATHVMLGISAAYVVIQCFEFVSLRKRNVKILINFLPALVYHVKKYRSWLPKALSTAAVAASLRAFPLWIGLLHLGASDQLAFAFAIGEVSFQLAMTYVNLLHSSRKLRESSTAKFSVTVLVFTLLAGVISILLYAFLRYGIGGRAQIDLDVLFFSSLYSVSIALFSLVRVKIWSGRNGTSALGVAQVLGGQSLMFMLPGVVLVLKEYNVEYIFLGAVFNVLVVALLNVANARVRAV